MNKLAVSARQEEILKGSILGDAYITSRGQIQFEQSSIQKEYLFWKHKQLESISYRNINVVYRYDKRFDKTYSSFRFWTRQYFLHWRNKFYVNNKKVIPRDIQLTPLALAVWYMDDGCFSDHKCIIATDGFEHSDIVFLQELLLNEFDITTVLKNGSKIMIRKKSHLDFFDIVSPFIIPSLIYKVLDPVTTYRKIDINSNLLV